MLIFSNGSLYSAPASTPPQRFSIPEEFGRIDESFTAKSDKTIVYIQDAHDSLEAQENIAKIIQHLVEHNSVKTVYEEGYEGPVPTDQYFSFIKDPIIKKKISYFLMDKLRLGGAEYAHVNRKKDFKLIGADSIKLHLENIKKYQESAKHKSETDKDLEAISKEIKRLADEHFPKELKEWMKLKERFDEGKLDLLNYLKRLTALKPSLGIPGHISLLLRVEEEKDKKAIQAVKEIDSKVLFREIDLLENIIADYFLKNQRDQTIFQHYKSVGLLKRLSDIRLSPDEYETVKNRLHELKTVNFARSIVEIAGKSIVLSKRWERNIQNAIRFYEIAEERDQFVKKGLDGFLASPDEKMAVMVFGGFHKNRLQAILKRKHISCVTVSPKITAISEIHQRYYRELMSVGRLPFEPSSYIRTAAPAGRAVEVIANPISFLLKNRAFPQELKDAIRSEMRNNLKIDVEIYEGFYWKQAPPALENIRADIEAQIRNTDLGRRFASVLNVLSLDHLKVWLRYDSISKMGSTTSMLNWETGELGVTIGFEDGNLLEQIVKEIGKNGEDYARGYHHLRDEFFRQGIQIHSDGAVDLSESQRPSYQLILRKIAQLLGFSNDSISLRKLLPSPTSPATSSSTLLQTIPQSNAEQSSLWQLLTPFVPGYGHRDGWRGFPGASRPDGNRYRFVTSFSPSGSHLSAFGVVDQLESVQQLVELLSIFSISIQVYRQYPTGSIVNMNTGGTSPFYGAEASVLNARFFAKDIFPNEVASDLQELQQLEKSGKLTAEILRIKAREIISKIMAFGTFTERFLWDASDQGLLDSRPSKASRSLMSSDGSKLTLLQRIKGWLARPDTESVKKLPASSGQSLIPFNGGALALTGKRNSSWLTLLQMLKPKHQSDAVGLVLDVINQWARSESEKPENWSLLDRIGNKMVPQFSQGSGGQGYEIGFHAERDDVFDNGVPYREYFIQWNINHTKLEALFRAIDKHMPSAILRSKEWKNIKQTSLEKVASFRSEMRAEPTMVDIIWQLGKASEEAALAYGNKEYEYGDEPEDMGDEPTVKQLSDEIRSKTIGIISEMMQKKKLSIKVMKETLGVFQQLLERVRKLRKQGEHIKKTGSHIQEVVRILDEDFSPGAEHLIPEGGLTEYLEKIKQIASATSEPQPANLIPYQADTGIPTVNVLRELSQVAAQFTQSKTPSTAPQQIGKRSPKDLFRNFILSIGIAIEIKKRIANGDYTIVDRDQDEWAKKLAIRLANDENLKVKHDKISLGEVVKNPAELAELVAKAVDVTRKHGDFWIVVTPAGEATILDTRRWRNTGQSYKIEQEISITPLVIDAFHAGNLLQYVSKAEPSHREKDLESIREDGRIVLKWGKINHPIGFVLALRPYVKIGEGKLKLKLGKWIIQKFPEDILILFRNRAGNRIEVVEASKSLLDEKEGEMEIALPKDFDVLGEILFVINRQGKKIEEGGLTIRQISVGQPFIYPDEDDEVPISSLSATELSKLRPALPDRFLPRSEMRSANEVHLEDRKKRDIFQTVIGEIESELDRDQRRNSDAVERLIRFAMYGEDRQMLPESLLELNQAFEKYVSADYLQPGGLVKVYRRINPDFESNETEGKPITQWLTSIEIGLRKFVLKHIDRTKTFVSPIEIAIKQDAIDSLKWPELLDQERSISDAFHEDLYSLRLIQEFAFDQTTDELDLTDSLERTLDRLYFFGSNQADGDASLKSLLGQKGANLAEMTRLGLPVPPGFTFPLGTHQRLKAFLLSEELSQRFLSAIPEIERRFAKMANDERKFGNPENPLLLSVRSGGDISEPGKYLTITKVGLHRSTLKGYAKQIGDRHQAYYDYISYIHWYAGFVLHLPQNELHKIAISSELDDFIYQPRSSLLHDVRTLRLMIQLASKMEKEFERVAGFPFPEPSQQLLQTIQAVVRSYQGADRFTASGHFAVNIQAFVSGAINDGKSLTGVAFSRNPFNGERKPYGEVLFNAEGHQLVTPFKVNFYDQVESLNDTRDWQPPQRFDEFQSRLPDVYEALTRYLAILEKRFAEIQDVEFTVEKGKLYLLQTRGNEESTTDIAKARILIDMVQEGALSEDEARSRISIGELTQLKHYLEAPVVKESAKGKMIGEGVPLIPGVATGAVAIGGEDAKKGDIVIDDYILEIGRQIAEYERLAKDIVGVITKSGSFSDHAAIAIRHANLPIPYVTGVTNLRAPEFSIQGKRRHRTPLTFGEVEIKLGDTITIDGNTGRIYQGLEKDDFAPSEITQVLSNNLRPEQSTLYPYYQKVLKWIDSDGGYAGGADMEDESYGRSELRKVDQANITKQNYLVSVDVNVFDALSDEQRTEFYKLFTARSEVRFIFNMDGDRKLTSALQELIDFDKRQDNVEVRMTPSISGFQGRKVISVTKEDVPTTTASLLEDKLQGSKDFYPVRYGKSDTEAGRLTAALLLLDSKDAVWFQRHPDFEIPASLRSEIRQLLDNFIYVARSA